MVQTDAQLTISATTIRNETVYGANTAVRVGDMFLDIIDSKVNVLNPTIYVANLTQTSTNAPVESGFANNIGTITVTRDDIGVYHISSTSLFTTGKTYCTIGQHSYDLISAPVTRNSIYWSSDSLIIINTQLDSGSGFALSDDVLLDTPVEIRVYP